jgi:ribosome-associated protein
MDLRKLQRIVAEALDDIKAQDIQVFNTTAQTELFDRVVIATASSNRQTRALASHLRERVKEAGGTVIAVEGEETGEWVLVDLGDIVVHIMQPAIRSYYRLEELWGQKPVRLKALSTTATRGAAAQAAAPAPQSKAPRAGSRTKPSTSSRETAEPSTRKTAKPVGPAIPASSHAGVRSAAGEKRPARRAGPARKAGAART